MEHWLLYVSLAYLIYIIRRSRKESAVWRGEEEGEGIEGEDTQ